MLVYTISFFPTDVNYSPRALMDHYIYMFITPGLLLHNGLMVSLFIRCTMRCKISEPVER